MPKNRPIWSRNGMVTGRRAASAPPYTRWTRSHRAFVGRLPFEGRIKVQRASLRFQTRHGFHGVAVAIVLAWAALAGCDGNAAQPGPRPAADGTAQDDSAANSEGRNPEDGLAHPFPRRVEAPSLAGGAGWLNTEKPLELADLRGKFVLLDFWTYCCINCMHVLPELKKLERAYPNELVVIGVHSAKFEGEKVTDNIREAILRYEIEHPVVNDDEMEIWGRFGVRSWPTLVLIDPTGQAVWLAGGEKTFDELNELMRRGLPYYRAEGLLDSKPLRFALERDKLAPQPLLFPGKILADEPGGRLFIADSGHNRIVITSLDGTLRETIGSGTMGRGDGDFAAASFDHPQGMTLVGETLFVADTENHSLRKIDLAERRVTTIAGTGEQARQPFSSTTDDVPVDADNPLLQIPLNSPWALLPHGGDLYIAMAGPHQIWRMSLDESQIAPYAGNGREDIIDGPLLPPRAYTPGFSAFAQPSGLATDGARLFVADTEGSSIRAVPFDAAGDVETLIGTSQLPAGRLFVFGDRDGKGLLERTVSAAAFRGDPAQTAGPLLQHAIGIAYADGQLHIADTYNNKIKVFDLETSVCRTVAGTGKPGHDDGPAKKATFNEPAGLAVAAGKLLVADTNSHAIRIVDLDGDRQVTTLDIDGLAPPATDEPQE